MKKIGDLMEELGFRPDSSEAVAKAFIKNLIRESNEQIQRKEQRPQEEKTRSDTNNQPQQLTLFPNIKRKAS